MLTTKSNDVLEQRACAVLNHHAKSFSWAARFLSSSAKRDATLLYAFARAADDFADEASLGPLHQRMQLLRQLQKMVLDPVPTFDLGGATSSNNSMALAVGHVLRKHRVNPSVVIHFMESLQADAGPRQLSSTEDLLAFAYGVAGTVGQMMRPILGAHPQAEPYAVALGVAMQLTNIARDVVEDAHRGRCYLPAQWGAEIGAIAFPKTQEQRAQAFILIEKLLGLADDFYAYAGQGIMNIAPENQRAIYIALSLYRSIGRKIIRRGPELYWHGRVHLTPLEKMRLIANVVMMTPRTSKLPPRDVVAFDLSHLHNVPGFYS